MSLIGPMGCMRPIRLMGLIENCFWGVPPEAWLEPRERVAHAI